MKRNQAKFFFFYLIFIQLFSSFLPYSSAAAPPIARKQQIWLSTSRNSTEKYKPAEVKSFFRVRNSLTKINMMSFASRSRSLPLSLARMCILLDSRVSLFARLFVFIQKKQSHFRFVWDERIRQWLKFDSFCTRLGCRLSPPPHKHKSSDKHDMLWNKTLQRWRTIRMVDVILSVR